MQLITNKKDIIAAIADVSATGQKLDNMIWIAAASIVAHVEKNREVTLVNKLIDAMPKGSRVNALIAYFDAVSMAQYDTDEKTFKFSKSKTTNQELAQIKSWTEYKPEQPYNGVDLHNLLIKTIKAADTALASTNADKRKKDRIKPSDLAALKALATSLGIELPAAKEAAPKAAPKQAIQTDPLAEALVAA